MATLNANALTTLARCKTDLDISNTSVDDQIIQYINTVSDSIEQITNRKFYLTAYTHRLSGNGKQFIALLQFPATILTTVAVDRNWVFGASTELPVGTEVDIWNETFLTRRSSCSAWPSGEPMNMQVTYTAGYGDGADPATLPDGIQQSCIEWVRLLYQSQGDRRIGRTSSNKLGDSVTWEDEVPNVIIGLLEPYRRDNVIKRAAQLDGLDLDGDGEDDK